MQDAGILLKKATEQKSVGDIDNAILTLKLAYKEISKTSIIYPVETFLRLPLYLQAAKRNEESWSEFHKLLDCGYPNQIKDGSVTKAEESIIYRKMRLFLQREKRYDEAILYGILSYLKMTVALKLQRRSSELKCYQDKKEIQEFIRQLLKKTNKESHEQELIDIIFNEAHSPDKIDFATIVNKLNSTV